MSIDTTELGLVVGVISPTTNQATELARALTAANALLDRVLTNAWREVPDALRDVWVLDTAANIYRRARGASSDGMLASADGTGVPGVANDPLQKSWAQIKSYTNRL